MSEVTTEEQAAMAVILDDKVRELVRKHLKDAFEDYDFVRMLYVYPLAEAVLREAARDGSIANRLLMQSIGKRMMVP